MRMVFAGALVLSLLPGTLWAGGDDWVPPVTDPLTLKECGECHMAFQAGFLPARSWDKMMDTLDDHFGDNASLPPESVAAIRAYLTANAGDTRPAGLSREFLSWVKPGGMPQRISENPEFVREHRRITPERLKQTQAMTLINCPACHKRAAEGWYEDD
ncbi:diheme cytochrome c [Pararhodospirillum photometricum]|uniref:Diheme cytochrome c n=1 Tax=Pararhodospirillum photometricum DSM 122 TaxID=1150469 RepID=H6SKG5_PARPM|nr:diheme cytochrome c [Pararhodospirillum photometricum]CCG08480.1 Diheme cytochrome c [Pararhodospirillum photometricum DSM 122]